MYLVPLLVVASCITQWGSIWALHQIPCFRGLHFSNGLTIRTCFFSRLMPFKPTVSSTCFIPAAHPADTPYTFPEYVIPFSRSTRPWWHFVHVISRAHSTQHTRHPPTHTITVSINLFYIVCIWHYVDWRYASGMRRSLSLVLSAIILHSIETALMSASFATEYRHGAGNKTFHQSPLNKS